MKTLKIDLGSRSYNIVIGDGLLAKAGEYVKPLLSMPKVIIITDDQVAPLYLKPLEHALKLHGITANAIILKAGEKTKSFSELEALINKIFECQPERKTTLIALGGGVIGDITGFAASIVLRGIPFIQIPTTLLAQVDSSVGGKTGINNQFGKNLVGSFYQPKAVLIDVEMLSSLDQRQFLSGYAEVVKYGLIKDAAFFNWLEENSVKILAKDKEALQHMVEVSCYVKAHIVASDEKENNVRALLNFGHTFGHALEAVTGYSDSLFHGEAVAIGMVMAAHLSCKLGLCTQADYLAIKNHLSKIGLRTSLKEINVKLDIQKIIEAMAQDKKISEGKMVFVVLKKMGEAILKSDIDSRLVKEILYNT